MYIYHFTSDNDQPGNNEYLIMSDFEYDSDELDSNTRNGFQFTHRYIFEGDTGSLPLDWELKPIS